MIGIVMGPAASTAADVLDVDLRIATNAALDELRRRGRRPAAMRIGDVDAARHSAHSTSRYCHEKWTGVCTGPAPIYGDRGRRILGAIQP